jgi:hypothetical protein
VCSSARRVSTSLAEYLCLAHKFDSDGPVPGDGTVIAYQDSDNGLRRAARGAATPSGYVNEFTDEQGSTQQIGYLTYKNIEDGSYNVQECADFCDSEQFCLGFNIFYERDPKNNPGSSCTNPDPITNVKCSLYGYPVANASATNQGQWREQFQVVIVASNGTSSYRNRQTYKLNLSRLLQARPYLQERASCDGLPGSHKPASRHQRTSDPEERRTIRYLQRNAPLQQWSI